MTTVTLFYTDNLDAHYGLGPEPNYTEVYSYDVGEWNPADDLDLCEAAFACFNRGSGREDEALDVKGLRSLSVGDIVKIKDGTGGRSYRCDTSGWNPIESWRVAA